MADCYSQVMSAQPVEFVLNCFERNVKDVTAEGFLTRAADQHQYPFQLRTLLVNNVSDRAGAAQLAQAAIDRGELDRFFFVDSLRESGLRATGLRERDFGRYLHWSDCCAAALVLDGPDLLCYADVDLTLDERRDWISTALEVMAHDPRVAVGNPTWVMPDGTSSVEREADETGDGYFLGYGFTDQIFLIHRSQFARPLRRRWLPLWLDCPATLRWVGAQGGLFFEQIVDGFMRRHCLMRVTVLRATFEPIPMSSYPVRSFIERVRAKRDSLVLGLLTRIRARWPNQVTDPSFRTTGLLDPAFAPDAGSA